MKIFDRDTFFAYVRRSPFGGRLTAEQVKGLESILEVWEGGYSDRDIRELAYILATAFHETGARMSPVREGFATTDAGARKIVKDRSYGLQNTKTKHVYYGRGYVQITWYENYLKIGKRIGVDLVAKPDWALVPDIALKILFLGMMEGLFTGRKLSEYFSATKEDPEGARRIVNGSDKKSLIANHYKQFLAALKTSEEVGVGALPVPPPDVPKDSAKPDGANLLVDKTMIGGMVTAGGGFAASMIGAISNPWALAAFAVVAIGVFLVVTGRIEIKSKAGA